MSKEKDKYIYSLVLPGDNTLKQLFRRFHIIPKGLDFTDKELEILNKYSFELTDPRVKAGKDGYIVERKQKKFTPEEVQAIKNEPGTYREKAKKYGVSPATIYKIMKDKY